MEISVLGGWFSSLICITSVAAPQGAGNDRAKLAVSMWKLKAVFMISFLLVWVSAGVDWQVQGMTSMSDCGEIKTGTDDLVLVNRGYPALGSRPVSAPGFTATSQKSVASLGSSPPCPWLHLLLAKWGPKFGQWYREPDEVLWEAWLCLDQWFSTLKATNLNV